MHTVKYRRLRPLPKAGVETISLKRLLFVNACILRETSRTNRLAHALIDALGPESVEEVVVEDLNLKPLDSKSLTERNALIAANDFDNAKFAQAHKFLDYTDIVIASPFYEGMYNSLLKIYLEDINVAGLLFRYSEEGLPVGNCRGTLYYVTTRGGPVTDDNDLGCISLKELSKMLGFDKFVVVSANNLDIVGNDPEEIVNESVSRIPEILKE